jgi:predicted CopG family antitoxin
MSTSIRISEETKRKLEAVKRDGETFDELLDRIVANRTESDIERLLGRAGDDDIVEAMDRTNRRLADSFDANTGRE